MNTNDCYGLKAKAFDFGKTTTVEKQWATQQKPVNMAYRKDGGTKTKIVSIVPLRIINGVMPTTGKCRHLLVAYNAKTKIVEEFDFSHLTTEGINNE